MCTAPVNYKVLGPDRQGEVKLEIRVDEDGLSVHADPLGGAADVFGYVREFDVEEPQCDVTALVADSLVMVDLATRLVAVTGTRGFSRQQYVTFRMDDQSKIDKMVVINYLYRILYKV